MRKGLRRGRSLTTAAVLAAGTLALAGCGSSSSSTGASSNGSTGGSSSSLAPSGASFTGSAVTLGMINNVGSAVDTPDAVAAAKGAVRAVNAAGGIAGHEVKFDFCNEALNPNTARSCARQMVSDHVMAMVGDLVVTAEPDVDTILKNAGIPSIGATSFPGAADTDTNSYTFTSVQASQNIAIAQAAIKLGDKRVADAQLQAPDAGPDEAVFKEVVNGAGGDWLGAVSVPQVTADVSTYAAALVNMKPQTVILAASTPGCLAIMKDMSALGYTGSFIATGASFLQSDLQKLGISNPITIVSPFPPPTATTIPAVTAFTKDMAAEKSSGDSDAPTQNEIIRQQTFSAWLAVIAVQKVADTAKATTAATLKTALNSAKAVDLDGAIPAWTPNAAGPISSLSRVSNNSFWQYTWTNGTVKLDSAQPYNVSSLISQYLKG